MAKTTARKKVHLVYVTGGLHGESYLLLNATQETFMGMRCIRGLYASPSKWHFIVDRIIRIPYEHVQVIVEYDSYEAYKDALKRHYEEKSK
jgi:hypothetical protein